MHYFVLMIMPHLNVRAEVRELKRKSRDFKLDDAAMALPDGVILCWFDEVESVPQYVDPNLRYTLKHLRDLSERMQIALARSESKICAALPDWFRFQSVEKMDGVWMLRSESPLENNDLLAMLHDFGSSAGLQLCPPPTMYASATLKGIVLGRAGALSLSTPISFKKYELVLYLAELPETQLNGFQFRSIARVHRRRASERRRSHTE